MQIRAYYTGINGMGRQTSRQQGAGRRVQGRQNATFGEPESINQRTSGIRLQGRHLTTLILDFIEARRILN
ncbi:MAG: hypothetical protein HC888_14990 [Candidatus Competibacteraceae bacterium]|nr:hypothetical protein [Candidatus Competibacteraceae bacterium]